MHYCEEKLGRIKSMHTSNFIFWVLSKFLLGLGIGVLLPMYFLSSGWIIAGWMLIAFAIILMIPAAIAAYGIHKSEPPPRPKMKAK